MLQSAFVLQSFQKVIYLEKVAMVKFVGGVDMKPSIFLLISLTCFQLNSRIIRLRWEAGKSKLKKKTTFYNEAWWNGWLKDFYGCSLFRKLSTKKGSFSIELLFECLWILLTGFVLNKLELSLETGSKVLSNSKKLWMTRC